MAAPRAVHDPSSSWARQSASRPAYRADVDPASAEALVIVEQIEARSAGPRLRMAPTSRPGGRGRPDLSVHGSARRPVLDAGRSGQRVARPGNRAAATLDQLEALVRSRLRAIQRRPDLINALLGQTGLTLESPPP